MFILKHLVSENKVKIPILLVRKSVVFNVWNSLTTWMAVKLDLLKFIKI